MQSHGGASQGGFNQGCGSSGGGFNQGLGGYGGPGRQDRVRGRHGGSFNTWKHKDEGAERQDHTEKVMEDGLNTEQPIKEQDADNSKWEGHEQKSEKQP